MNNVSNPYPRSELSFQLIPGSSIGQSSIVASHICRDPQTGAVQPQRIFQRIFLNQRELRMPLGNDQARRVLNSLRDHGASLSFTVQGEQLLVSTPLQPRQS